VDGGLGDVVQDQDCGASGLPDGSLVLVFIHAGCGVFDARSGSRVARDQLDDWSYLDDESGTAEGIGPLEGQRIGIAGLMSQRQLPSSADFDR
jgi:hypothetical protein